MPPMLSAARSRPVITATTPGILIARRNVHLTNNRMRNRGTHKCSMDLASHVQIVGEFSRPVTSGKSSLRIVWRSLPKRKPALLAFCVPLRCALMDALILIKFLQQYFGGTICKTSAQPDAKPGLATIRHWTSLFGNPPGHVLALVLMLAAPRPCHGHSACGQLIKRRPWGVSS